MNRTSPLLQHPHPGCDLARPGGHGADRNLNFRMSVQAGCCVGTSAGDYPINPVEWSPVTSPACPGKWGSNIPTKMKTITSLLIINTVQYRAHSSLSAGFAPRFLKSNFTSTQQGALQLITCGGDSSDTDMRAAMLSSTGGSWVLGSHCWHAGPGTTQPTNLRAMTTVHYTVQCVQAACMEEYPKTPIPIYNKPPLWVFVWSNISGDETEHLHSHPT